MTETDNGRVQLCGERAMRLAIVDPPDPFRVSIGEDYCEHFVRSFGRCEPARYSLSVTVWGPQADDPKAVWLFGADAHRWELVVVDSGQFGPPGLTMGWGYSDSEIEERVNAYVALALAAWEAR